MRVVIDTNVVASAIFFGGRPRQLLEHLMKRDLEAFATNEIIMEYQETCDELCSRYPNKPLQLPLKQVIDACKIIEPNSVIRICRDADDDKFIECAVDASCFYIVSGDKDLLSIRQFQNITIMTVAEFLTCLQNDSIQ